ncbi:MAG: nucleotidyltransferase family protein [Chloroflexi bacterium]|nr:nucleotidyltransferase family protein [Chloroflexota bacterium]MQC19272.1 nucleotidyltransferase family protein [Chloroflexota bacterium]
MSDVHRDHLVELIRGCPWFMEALGAARAVLGTAEWAIGAGAIRDLVFDAMHGRMAAVPRDIDLAFFDEADLSVEREDAIESELRRLAPGLPFEARNQARVHLWYEEHFGEPIEPYRSLGHAISTWPETATSVACRLRADDSIEVIAPLGLDDLFAGILRRNPAQVTETRFRERLARWAYIDERWPSVRVVMG